jgi:hypothetical protein
MDPFLSSSLSGVSDGLHPARIWTPERVACARDVSWSKLTRFVWKTHHDIHSSNWVSTPSINRFVPRRKVRGMESSNPVSNSDELHPP